MSLHTAKTSAAMRSLVLLTLAVGLGACGSDSSSNDGAAAPKTYGLPAGKLAELNGVTTSLAPAKVRAGELVTVKCFGQPGDVEIPAPEYTITPAEGTKKAGASLTAAKTGQYQVACTLHDGRTVDTNPAILVVVPGDAVSIKTVVEPASIASGDKAKVTCSGVDTFGNAFAGADVVWQIAVAPADLGDVADAEVTGRVAGKGKVTCGLENSTASDVQSADLEVKPGKAAKTTTKLDPDTVKAGEGSTVTCGVTDAAGNALPLDGVTIDKPADVDLTGTSVSSKLKGEHTITCKATGATDEGPATLKVTAADPKDWKLISTANKTVWEFDDTIVLRGVGTDEFGNETNQLKVTMPPKITGDPKGLKQNPAAPAEPKSYTFAQDGKYTFTATLVDFPALGERSLDALCDSEGPKVLISSPARGATLTGGNKVTVKGMVVDDWSAVKSFNMNGTDVPVAADGSFSHEIDSPLGMTALIWRATDANERESKGVQSYYYSDKWYPTNMPGAATKAKIDNGIGVWLGQQMIDSGKHDHADPKDLATVVEIIIGTLDWDTLLGGAAQKINQPLGDVVFKATASIKNVQMGDKAFNSGYPEVSITVIEGGMNLIIKVHNFSADFVLDGVLDSPGTLFDLPVNQTITISAKAIEIQMDMLLSLDEKTGKIKSETKNVDVNLTNFKFNVSGLVGILVNWLSTAIQPLTEAALEQVLKGVMQSMFGSQVGALLEQLALNLPLELPPLIGDGKPAKLQLTSSIGMLQFFPTKAQAGGIIVGMDASMTSEKGVKQVTLGSIGRAGCLDAAQLKKQVFNPGQKFPLELGMADDFINQLLNALWWSGALTLTIDKSIIGSSVDLSTFGVTDLTVTTDFWLPPILNTCVDNKIKLQIGDLGMNAKLTLSDTPIDIDLFITLQAEAELKAVKNPKTGATEIGFALKNIDFLELEVVNINAEAKNLEGLFINLIKTVMMPKLVDALSGGLGSFPLPAFDLSSFSPSIPKGTSLELAIQKIENANGYTYINGYFN